MNTDITELKKLLSSPKKVVIVTHKSPDGDAIGSSLGMYHYLRQKGHKVQVVTPNDYPKFLQWMPANDHVLEYKIQEKQVKAKFAEAEIIFCLDFNHLNRIEEIGSLVDHPDAYVALIDHHPDPDDFADYNLTTTEASSTAQLVYEFMELMEETELINQDIAQCLYAGIVTDTGSFRFPATSSKTMRIAAALMDTGIDHSTIFNNIYNQNSEDRLRLFGFSLFEKLVVHPVYHTAYMGLTKEELNRFNYKSGDTEGLVNYGLTIKGVKFSVLFTEFDDEVKISFRSVGEFPANEVAKDNFNGGGHRNAAGGRMKKSLAEVLDKFEDILPFYKEKLKQAK